MGKKLSEIFGARGKFIRWALFGYAVDINGNIWSKRKSWCNPKGKWRKMKPIRSQSNGLQVFLQTKSGSKGEFIHVIVLETFVGPRPKGYETQHMDGDNTNNALSNLRWASHQTNMADCYEHGTMSCGSRHPTAKINESIAEQIIIRSAKGETRASLAREFGISAEVVRRIAIGKSWRHVVPKTK